MSRKQSEMPQKSNKEVLKELGLYLVVIAIFSALFYYVGVHS